MTLLVLFALNALQPPTAGWVKLPDTLIRWEYRTSRPARKLTVSEAEHWIGRIPDPRKSIAVRVDFAPAAHLKKVATASTHSLSMLITSSEISDLATIEAALRKEYGCANALLQSAIAGNAIAYEAHRYLIPADRWRETSVFGSAPAGSFSKYLAAIDLVRAGERSAVGYLRNSPQWKRATNSPLAPKVGEVVYLLVKLDSWNNRQRLQKDFAQGSGRLRYWLPHLAKLRRKLVDDEIIKLGSHKMHMWRKWAALAARQRPDSGRYQRMLERLKSDSIPDVAQAAKHGSVYRRGGDSYRPEAIRKGLRLPSALLNEATTSGDPNRT